MNMMTRIAAYTRSSEVTAHHDHDIIPVSFKTRNTRVSPTTRAMPDRNDLISGFIVLLFELFRNVIVFIFGILVEEVEERRRFLFISGLGAILSAIKEICRREFDAPTLAALVERTIGNRHQTAEGVKHNVTGIAHLVNHSVHDVELKGTEVLFLTLDGLNGVEGSHSGDVRPNIIGPTAGLE